MALRTSTHILRAKEYVHRCSISAVIAVCSMLSNHQALATYRPAEYLDPTASSIMTLSSLLTQNVNVWEHCPNGLGQTTICRGDPSHV